MFSRMISASILVMATMMAAAEQARAGFVIPLKFSAGLNTGYSIGANSVDEHVDWFVFDANGSDLISFHFDRTVAAPDLCATIYCGDTTGFDYVAAGAMWDYALFSASDYHYGLTYVSSFDDTHDDSHNGPGGDPDFSLLLQAGRYSLALTSLNLADGTYEFTANVSSASPFPVSGPGSMITLAAGALCMLGFRKRKRRLDAGLVA